MRCYQVTTYEGRPFVTGELRFNSDRQWAEELDFRHTEADLRRDPELSEALEQWKAADDRDAVVAYVRNVLRDGPDELSGVVLAEVAEEAAAYPDQPECAAAIGLLREMLRVKALGLPPRERPNVVVFRGESEAI